MTENKRTLMKMALRLSAWERNQAWGISYHPPIRSPSINRRHVDGPYLNALDGGILWLSLWERLLTKLGIWDAWDIEWRRFPLPVHGSRNPS